MDNRKAFPATLSERLLFKQMGMTCANLYLIDLHGGGIEFLHSNLRMERDGTRQE